MVKSKVLKKVLVSMLVVSVVMAPALQVGASGAGSGTGGNGTVVNKIISQSTGGAITTVTEIPSTSSVSLGGKAVSSTVTGVYIATNFRGTVITTDAATISAGYGLKANEKAYAKFSNTDPKRSTLAMASLNGAAQLMGATAGPCFNFEFGKISGGHYSILPKDGSAIRLSVGIPEGFMQEGCTYAVICVRAGGALTILPNISTDASVITFDTTAGAGAYMLVKY